MLPRNAFEINIIWKVSLNRKTQLYNLERGHNPLLRDDDFIAVIRNDLPINFMLLKWSTNRISDHCDPVGSKTHLSTIGAITALHIQLVGNHNQCVQTLSTGTSAVWI